jgi:hypothetical protein
MPGLTLADVLSYRCPVGDCARALGTLKLMRSHLLEHVAGNVPEDYETMQRRNACTVCHRSFPDKRALSKHWHGSARCRAKGRFA